MSDTTTETTDPRRFARARAELRRHRAYHDALDAAVEWEEQAEALTRKNAEADARLAESERRAAAVDADAAARRAKLDAETDRERAHLLEENATLKRENEGLRAEQATLKAEAEAAKAECRRWVEAKANLAPEPAHA